MEDSLVQKISEAFPAGIPPVGRVANHHCGECEEVDKLLRGRSWPSLAHEFPQYCHDVYPLLTLEAQIYYLPAFMSYSVQSPDMMTGISLATALASGKLPHDAFDPNQRAVILSWLEDYYRNHEAGEPPEDMGLKLK